MKFIRSILFIMPVVLLTACGGNSGSSKYAGNSTFHFTNPGLPQAFEGVSYAAQLSTTNGVAPVSYDWAGGYTPPAWLTLSPTGELSGTPASTGSITVSVEGADSDSPANTATATFNLEVLTRPEITTTSLPRSVSGTSYNEQLAYTSPGAVSPTFNLAAGSALPTGLGLNSAGVVGGTTTDTGLFPVTIEMLIGATIVDTSTLDLVVYESIPYTYVEDANETPTPNDSTGDATQLAPGASTPGLLTAATPIVQAAPLTLNSDQNLAKPDPDDFFAFNIANPGTISVNVFFRGLVGEIDVYLWHYNGSTHQVSIVAQSTGYLSDDESITLHNAPLSFPGAGYYYLQVHAPFDAAQALWNRNAYTFRVTFNDLTVSTDLLEPDSNGGGAIDAQVVATNAGGALANPVFSIVNGALPNGVTFTNDGRFTGTPTEFGLREFTVQVEDNGLTVQRDIRVRFFDSVAGDYWQSSGQRLLHGASGDQIFEAWGDAMVVAPHPDYPTEGAIYVIGGYSGGMLKMTRVFHTDRAGIPASKHFKFEDIAADLPEALRYHDAEFIQHTYGGYIYVVGGELDVQPGGHTVGDLTRNVLRLQVADGAGIALSHPLATSWQTVASLPGAAPGGEDIRGWAEFGLAIDDQPADADDRIYLLGGRYDLEDSVGSGTYSRTFHDEVLMLECPVSGAGAGTWFWKSDAAPYTPRRFPAVTMIDDCIYVVAGREGGVGQTGSGGTIADYVEMYRPDNFQANPALSLAGASSFPTMNGGGGYYPMYATLNGSLYVWCGWDAMFTGTKTLHRFDPNASGTGGAMTRLTDADWGTGFGAGVAHDGKLWIISGIGHGATTESLNLVYNP